MSKQRSRELELISVSRIWDRGVHNALTDLIFFHKKWFLCFRESDAHVFGANGTIRILTSSDGEAWTTSASIVEKGIDLRDPKFSVTADGRLHLLMGGTRYENGIYITRQPRVAFSQDGFQWSANTPVLGDHEWLWRLSWYQGTGYGASYRLREPRKRHSSTAISLFKTTDGVNFQLASTWNITGTPSEATVRFLDDETMISLVRRDRWPDDRAWIGTSAPPYEHWKWVEAGMHLGGPNFIVLPNGSMYAAGRLEARTSYGYFEKTAILKMTRTELATALWLPSGGVDCSYPGMVFKDGCLWVSYYSSHERNTAIYLAKINIAE